MAEIVNLRDDLVHDRLDAAEESRKVKLEQQAVQLTS